MPKGIPSEAAWREKNPVRRSLKMLGPGLITGAADDDPSGIGTYTAAGASLGFATLWTAVLTLPMMAVVQYVCAKIGMVSGATRCTAPARTSWAGPRPPSCSPPPPECS